jgi:multidrug resistance protein, MATE family
MNAPASPANAPIITRPNLAQLLTLAWPVIISRSSQVVVGFTDAVMCARLGESALAATTAGATNTFNILVLPMGMAFIVSSFASQLSGGNDHSGARRYAWYGLGLAVFAGILCVGAVPLVTSAVNMLGYENDVKAMMASYLRIRLIGGAFVIGLEALGNYYGGLGNTRLPMFAQLLAMVLNVVLNWLLIFGNFGFPAMGVDGAALASAIAPAIAFSALFACFHFGVGQPVKPKRGEKLALKLDEFLRMVRFGLPVGLNWFVEFAAFSFFMNIVLAGLGTTVVAAMMSVLQLNSLSFMPAFAIASAGSIFVGQAIGAKALDDVPRTVHLTLKTTAAWQGFVGLWYLAFPAVLMSAFVKDAEQGRQLLAIGGPLLMLSAAWQLFDAAAMTYSEALRAAGDTTFTLWARAGIAWLVFAPGAWISVSVLHLGDMAAAAWMVLYLAMLALLMWRRFHGGRWRSVDLTGQQPGMH